MNKIRYSANNTNFYCIPGKSIAYWASEKLLDAFTNETLYSKSISPSQNITGNNDKYVRKHWELDMNKVDKENSWIFYAKGGGYRKWWGNLFDIVNWTPQARNIYQHGDGKHASQIINKDYWYRKGITWGLISSYAPSFRVMPQGATFDKGGSTIIVNDDIFLYSLGLLNSNVYIEIAKIFNPTLNNQVKDVRNMPIVNENIEEINELVETAISISKNDYDLNETSWDFKKNPLVR